MKLKPTLVAVAVASAFVGSVQAQLLTNEFRSANGSLNITGSTYRTFNNTGTLAAWGRGITGQGVRVAVLDSGFDLTHTDLQGQVAAAKNFNQSSLNQIAANTNNIRGQVQTGTDITWSNHGTWMASIIAGRGGNLAVTSNGTGVAPKNAIGIAPGAQLILAQIGEGVRPVGTSWNSTDTISTTTSVYSALRWAEANGAIAANMSFGSNFDSNFQRGTQLVSAGIYQAPSNYNRASATNPCFASMYGNCLSDLMNFANASKNMVLVAAAGNQSLPYAQFPGAYATQVDTNGNLVLGGRMLIVGSVNANNVISSFSNRAGSLCNNLVGTICNDKYYVKDFFVVAPGENIIGSIPNQSVTCRTTLSEVVPCNSGIARSGTSQATAIVTGGIALIKQAWPQLTAAQIVDLVKTTSTDLGAKGVDEIYGWGLVNFDKATQPTGRMTIASVRSNSMESTNLPVASTGLSTSGSIGFASSSVLANTMTIDGIGRHYAVDFTKSVASNPIATYQYSSAWLALNPMGYYEQNVPVTYNYSMRFMRSLNGDAVEVQHHRDDVTYSIQVGSMREQAGFLGNYGSGAMSFGNSATDFAQFGVSRNFNDTVVFGSYGQASTRAGSAPGSLIQLDNRIASQTWRAGFGQRNVILSKDQLSLTAVSPVKVTRGNATVTAVTDYRFSEDAEGNVRSQSVVTTESISLRPQVRPMDLVLGYTVTNSNTSRLTMNFARQYNVSGQSGQTATGFSMTFNKFF